MPHLPTYKNPCKRLQQICLYTNYYVKQHKLIINTKFTETSDALIPILLSFNFMMMFSTVSIMLSIVEEGIHQLFNAYTV